MRLGEVESEKNIIFILDRDREVIWNKETTLEFIWIFFILDISVLDFQILNVQYWIFTIGSFK